MRIFLTALPLRAILHIHLGLNICTNPSVSFSCMKLDKCKIDCINRP